MPLTALDALGTLIDSTTATDETWRAVHKNRPRSILRCRGCGGGMQAKVSSRGLRFFAHDQVRLDCPSNGESPDHRWLKSRLAAAARAAGWAAEIEAEPRAGDIGGWRADVLAIAPDGARRVALEAQLAPMTEAVGVERTDRYAQDGIETLWITLKNAPWLWKLLGCKVERDDSPLEDDGQPPLVATRGCAKLTAIAGWRSGPQWAPVNVLLSRLIQAMLDDSVGTYVVKFLPEKIPTGTRSATSGTATRSLSHLGRMLVALLNSRNEKSGSDCGARTTKLGTPAVSRRCMSGRSGRCLQSLSKSEQGFSPTNRCGSAYPPPLRPATGR